MNNHWKVPGDQPALTPVMRSKEFKTSRSILMLILGFSLSALSSLVATSPSRLISISHAALHTHLTSLSISFSLLAALYFSFSIPGWMGSFPGGQLAGIGKLGRFADDITRCQPTFTPYLACTFLCYLPRLLLLTCTPCCLGFPLILHCFAGFPVCCFSMVSLSVGFLCAAYRAQRQKHAEVEGYTER